MLHELLWAKADSPNCQKPQWHSLLYHMIDSAVVTKVLWDDVFQKGIKNFYCNSLRLNDQECIALLSFMSGIHDIGKACPAFQFSNLPRWEPIMDFLNDSGPYGRCEHEDISANILFYYFKKKFGADSLKTEYDKEQKKDRLKLVRFRGLVDLARGFAFCVGGHHGVFITPTRRNGISIDSINGKIANNCQKWVMARCKLLRILANKTGVGSLKCISDKFPSKLPCSFYTALAGLITLSDWISSDDENFPYMNDSQSEAKTDGYWKESFVRANTCIDKIGLSGWELPSHSVPFGQLFPSFVNLTPPQEKVVELVKKKYLDEPSLVIIESPMGEGKTEAALYLADCWNIAFQQQGSYFALPTIASSDQMFGRIKEFMLERYKGTKRAVNLMLLHGHAFLSGDLTELNKKYHRQLFVSNHADDVSVMASKWFSGSKKGLLLQFGVGTIDQALLGVLQVRHSYLRLFGFVSKTVIIDEVHAYDAFMTTHLKRLLEWLAGLNCSVILLSATLPKFRRKELIDAYYKGRAANSAPLIHKDASYPRVTYVNSKEMNSYSIGTSDASRKRVNLTFIPPEKISFGNRLKDKLKDGGCAAVICNSVDVAQELYLYLKKEKIFSSDELILLHARMPWNRRKKIEDDCIKKFGKPEKDGSSPSRPKDHERAVLISTQIIEQSLDLDFDFMVSEMCPIDLIFQRLGRMIRHHRKMNSLRMNPELWLFEPDADSNDVKQFNFSFGYATDMIYHQYILYRTWLVLERGKLLSLNVPDDIERLIEEVYDPTLKTIGLTPEEECYLSKYRIDFEAIANHKSRKAELDEICCSPFENGTRLDEFNKELADDEFYDAVTRLVSPTVNAVCLYADGRNSFLDNAMQNKIDLTRKLDLRILDDVRIVKDLLGNSVSIASRLIVPKLKDKKFWHPEWDRVSLLKKHCILKFDCNGECCFPSIVRGCIFLDEERGIVILRS